MSDELPPPPPGITLMSPQEFLDRRAAPAEAVSVADILAEADHIEKNGKAIAAFGGDNVDEGRCRELCAMYLREFVQTLRMEQRLAAFGAAPASAAPSETPRTDAKRANPDGFSYDEAIAWAEQLERARNAWEAKFNAECEKHDATTLRAMKAERDLALAIDHIEKDDKEIERLHSEIAALRSKK